MDYALPPFDEFMRDYVGTANDTEQKYRSFVLSKKRYLVCKGSRGSKKSCTAALKIVYLMMYYYFFYGAKPHTIVIRRYMNTHWNSTRAQLIWAIYKLKAEALWQIPKGMHTLTFKPSGQQILFRGMDDPQSITSITVADGKLCWGWFEESFQMTSEDDFNKIDMSVRGYLPDKLFYQFILTFNPWSDRHWLKSRFFDDPDENTLALTTNYMVNEFLSDSDRRLYEIMKEKNPRRYRIEGLGEWGIAEGLIFENWREEDFDIEELLEKNRNKKDRRGLPAFVSVHGMDFGYNDPTAFVAAYADKADYKIYIYYEFHEVQMENRKIAAKLIEDGFGDAVIRADSEDPRTINELRLLGLRGIRGARKGAGSVLGGIQKLQDYEFIISPRCPHFIESVCNYAWKKDKVTDKIMNEPEHEFSHLCVTGDTLVNTIHGKQAIKDLVGKREKVFCYNLESKKVEIQECFNAQITGKKKEIFELELADGQKIRMTASHKVLTSRGYIECQNLTEDDCIVSVRKYKIRIDELRYRCYNTFAKIKEICKCTIQKVLKYSL